MSQIDEVCVKEPQCCEIFDRFCFGCREIQILKAQQSYRERLRRLEVFPARTASCGHLRTIAHNYTPDFLEALEELIELYQARALKSKKAAFRSSVWREEMRTLEWKVITRVEDIDSDTWESDLGLGQKFKEFIETGSFKRLEEMRGSPPA